jgi:DNA-binding SARP family transcriptional activator
VRTLSGELLPGWYDDWVMVEAEDWRQLRLHALETLAGRLVDEERFGDAAASALAAVRAEPLRETARGALIRVHLAEGNQSEAIREYDRYRDLLLTELGLEPTDKLRQQLNRPRD